MTINHIIVVDVETTGLDPRKDSIIELAAIHWSISNRCIAEQFSTLCFSEGNAAEHINRIPSNALLSAPSPVYALKRLKDMVASIPAVDGPEYAFMAHSASFDRSFIETLEVIPGPWICSKDDVEWTHSRAGASCVTMALEHGVAVTSAHRALTDCQLIAGVLGKYEAPDLWLMLDAAMEPKARFQAMVSYDEREKAREAGFQWSPGEKGWFRRMSVAGSAKLGFSVKEVKW